MDRYRPVIAGSTLPLPPRQAGNVTPRALREDLGRLAAVGFESVDLVDSWLAFADLSSASRDHLAAAVADLGLGLSGISAIRRSIVDPIDGDANLEYTYRSIETAAQLGAPVLSIGFHRPLTEQQRSWDTFWAVEGPSDGPREFALAVERLTALCQHAASHQVELSLELYEDTLVGSGAAAVELLKAVDAPNLGINADLANLHRVPRALTETWRQTLELVIDRMNYWHVKNYRRASAYPDGPYLAWPTLLGDGDIDYRHALRTARDHGYGGPLCIEHYGGDGLYAQAAGRSYLESLLETL